MQYLCLYFSLAVIHRSYSFSFSGTRYATVVPALLARPGHGGNQPHDGQPQGSHPRGGKPYGGLSYSGPLLGGQATPYNNAVVFNCPFGQVLLVEEFGDNEIKMGCGIMDICNEQRICTYSPCPGLCNGKANYLSAVKEKFHDGDVSGFCCQYSPPVNNHINDNCQVFAIWDSTSQRPVILQSTLIPQRHQHGPSIGGGAGAGASAVSGGGYKIHMSLLHPAPHPPPVQVVKGIQKTPTGYTITYCTVQCDHTTSTINPTTVHNQQPFPPPLHNGAVIPNTESSGGGSSNGGHNGHGGSSNSGGSHGGTSHEGSSHGGGSHGGSSHEGSSHGGGSHGGSSHGGSSHGGGFHSGFSHESSSHGGASYGGSPSSGNSHGDSSQDGSSNGNSHGGTSHGQSRVAPHSNSNSHSASSSAASSPISASSSQNVQTHANGDGSHESSYSYSHGRGHGRGHGHGSGSGGGGGWGGCFSSEMTTETKFGLKRMDELKIGDEVLVARSDQIESYQPIEWFYHQNKDVETPFVTIRTESNRTLSLTPNHLLTFVPCFPKWIELSDLEEHINYDSLFSEKAKPGMCLAAKIGDHFESDLIQFVSVGMKKGVFSPITTQGTIIVNDIQASCYSNVEHHYLQYGMHKSLLHIRSLLEPIWKLFNRSKDTLVIQNEVPIILRFIGEIAQLVVPSIMYK